MNERLIPTKKDFGSMIGYLIECILKSNFPPDHKGFMMMALGVVGEALEKDFDSILELYKKSREDWINVVNGLDEVRKLVNWE